VSDEDQFGSAYSNSGIAGAVVDGAAANPYNAVQSDNVIYLTSTAPTVNLPAPPNQNVGKIITVVTSTATTVTYSPALFNDFRVGFYQTSTVQCDGTNWFLTNYGPSQSLVTANGYTQFYGGFTGATGLNFPAAATTVTNDILFVTDGITGPTGPTIPNGPTTVVLGPVGRYTVTVEFEVTMQTSVAFFILTPTPAAGTSMVINPPATAPQCTEVPTGGDNANVFVASTYTFIVDNNLPNQGLTLILDTQDVSNTALMNECLVNVVYTGNVR